MPISRQVRITRSAISPRFATRTLVTLANRHQHFVGSDDRSLFREDLPNRPADGCHDVVLHFHRLQHDDNVAQPDAVARRDLDLDHHALHRRLDGPVTGGTAALAGAAPSPRIRTRYGSPSTSTVNSRAVASLGAAGPGAVGTGWGAGCGSGAAAAAAATGVSARCPAGRRMLGASSGNRM